MALPLRPRSPLLPRAHTARRFFPRIDEAPWRAALARHHAAPLLLSLGLAACASGLAPTPTAVTDLPAPAQWVTRTPHAEAATDPGAAPPVDAQAWWQALDDPELQAWISAALQGNPDLAAVQARLDQARATARQTQAAEGPGVDASASAQRSRQGSATSRRYAAGLSAAWEPDLFGGARAATRAAGADAQAQAALWAQSRLSLVAEVVADYITRQRDRQRAALARSLLESQTRTQRITAWRREAGLASGLDVDQGLSALAQTRAGIPALDASVEILGHALGQLAGQLPGAPAPVLGPATPSSARADLAWPRPAVRQLPARLPVQTLEARPDVQAALAAYAAAAARVDGARAARWPSLSLSASTGLEMLAWGGSASLARTLLASLDLPLYDGGARQAQIDVRQAALREARATLQATVLTALQEVEDALVSWRAAGERQAALQPGVDAATRAAELARTRYQAGLADLRTVLDTQRSELTLRDTLVQTEAEETLAQVRLIKALAGAWVPEASAAGAPATSPNPTRQP